MIAIASDHGGYLLKEHIKAYLAAKGITCEDLTTSFEGGRHQRRVDLMMDIEKE